MLYCECMIVPPTPTLWKMKAVKVTFWEWIQLPTLFQEGKQLIVHNEMYLSTSAQCEYCAQIIKQSQDCWQLNVNVSATYTWDNFYMGTQNGLKLEVWPERMLIHALKFIMALWSSPSAGKPYICNVLWACMCYVINGEYPSRMHTYVTGSEKTRHIH